MTATAIEIRWNVGDLVRIRTGKSVYRVVEIDPQGVGFPPPPSTYLVRLASVEPPVGRAVVYGDRALDRVA